jgi:HAD superfamily hydrolase (TIGR01484 family)
VKIQGLFSDFDGTLSPLELRREDAGLPPRLKRLLTKVSKNIKLGIVTTKDLAFIKDRVPFAHGIAATCGLEMQVGDRAYVDERAREPNKKMETAYKETLARILPIPDNIAIERKETEEGNLLAFCVDWRLSKNWDEARRKAAPLLTFCKELGLFVMESDVSPFANVFPFQVDKGAAYLKLRTELGVTGPTMYLGDSEADDSAFQLAEVSIGIKHRRVMPRLQCKYRVEFLELEGFLSSLIDADFDFQENMIQRNTQD